MVDDLINPLNALSFFNAVPGKHLILATDAPTFTILGATNAYIEISLTKREDILGKGVFEVFSDDPQNKKATGTKNLYSSLLYVLQHKKEHRMEDQRYDIFNPKTGKFEHKVWSPVNTPVLDDDGDIKFILHTVEDITNKVLLQKVEEERDAAKIIKESEARFQSLIKAAPIGICLFTGQDLTIELPNQIFLNILGKGTDVIGKPLAQVCPATKGGPILKKLNDVFVSGQTYQSYETKIESAQIGKIDPLYFNFSYTPLFNSEGKVYAILTLAVDVTDNVHNRQALEKSEANLRNIISQAPVAMNIIKGPNFIVDIVNDRMLQILDTTAENLLRQPVFEALPALANQGFEEILEEVYKTGQSYSAFEVPVTLQRNGKLTTIYVNFVYEPLREINGTITGVVTVAIEVTEQVVARKKIEDSEQKLKHFKFMADQARDPFILMRSDGTFAYLNQKAKEAWNYTDEEAQHIRVPDVDPIYNDEVYAQVFERAQKEVLPQFETLHKRKDGHIYPVEINMGGLTLGGVPHMFAVARDISERKKMEEAIKENEVLLQKKVEERTIELENKNKELQYSNANLEEFAYAASHDMKEPIRKIHYFSDRLKERFKDKLDERDQHFFERMELATKRMGTLIDDLLLYSHFSSGATITECIDLNQIVALVKEDLELAIEEKNAQIIVETLPTIKGQQRQLQQLFDNLIGNALKYSKQDTDPIINISSKIVKGKDTTYRQTFEMEDKMYHFIQVIDNGIGFEQDQAERIFNVFTRLHGNSEYRGTGVGLSIVRKVAENHGGFVWAESEPGIGSTLNLLFPV